MNTKICIDKRILLLVLFSIPVIAIILIAGTMNSTKFTTKSKANEEQNLQTFPTTSIPEGVRGFCLEPRKNTLENTVDLYLKQGTDIISQIPIKIYFVASFRAQYIGLINSLPSDVNQTPVFSISLNSLPAGEGIRFVGVQNGEENHLSSFSGSCSPIVAKNQ